MYSAVVDQITDANLPPETRATALRLLRVAHPDNGHVAISKQEACELAGGIVWGSLQRQLGQLAKAHLIHYSTNGDGLVYCTFKAFALRLNAKNSTPNVDRIDVADQGREEPARLDRRLNAKNSTSNVDGIDATSHARTLDLTNTGRKVGRKDLPTYLPEGGAGDGGPDPDEQARSVAVLTDPDVGMWDQTARQLAARYPFENILRHVMHWAYQHEQGEVHSPMVLEARLARNTGPPIGPGSRASPLYRRHVAVDTDGETEDDRRRRYIPDEFSDIVIG
jgi:hypothetical protein